MKLDDLLKSNDPANPWCLASANGRRYLTPEDVSGAVLNGGTVLGVTQAVLQAVELKCVEDASATAFVALRMFKNRT